MKIYTKKGDAGKTSLSDGIQRMKHESPFEILGTLDELNSHIGLIIAFLSKDNSEIQTMLKIQLLILQTGYVINCLCSDKKMEDKEFEIYALSTTELEERIDAMTEQLPKLTHFIIPSGDQEACFSHLARTVCRRLERLLVAQLPLHPRVVAQTHDTMWFGHIKSPNQLKNVIMYFNRLSDYLFTLARFLNHQKEHKVIFDSTNKLYTF